MKGDAGIGRRFRQSPGPGPRIGGKSGEDVGDVDVGDIDAVAQPAHRVEIAVAGHQAVLGDIRSRRALRQPPLRRQAGVDGDEALLGDAVERRLQRARAEAHRARRVDGADRGRGEVREQLHRGGNLQPGPGAGHREVDRGCRDVAGPVGDSGVDGMRPSDQGDGHRGPGRADDSLKGRLLPVQEQPHRAFIDAAGVGIGDRDRDSVGGQDRALRGGRERQGGAAAFQDQLDGLQGFDMPLRVRALEAERVVPRREQAEGPRIRAVGPAIDRNRGQSHAVAQTVPHGVKVVHRRQADQGPPADDGSVRSAQDQSRPRGQGIVRVDDVEDS